MLKLFVTPSYIIFRNLNNEKREELSQKYNIIFGKENKVIDKPENLYYLIVNLSKDFDIEVS